VKPRYTNPRDLEAMQGEDEQRAYLAGPKPFDSPANPVPGEAPEAETLREMAATDRSVTPLCVAHHREGPDSVQALGRMRFQGVHGYDLDARCAYWQERWDAQERAA